MAASACAGNTRFRIGAGIHDITGPAAEREMMGYVMMTPPQETAGIHMRLRARAFVVHSPCNDKRFAFVNCDLGMIFQAVKLAVVDAMATRCDGGYRAENILLSATHTHSGPGGYSHYALYNLISLGFDQAYFDAIVDGICEAICQAHANLEDGRILISEGELLGVSKNRSPEAYKLNPDALPPPHDTDKTMTVLRFEAFDGTEVGTINWFAVHGTSLGNTNHLISGDNKGLAAYLFEESRATDYSAAKTFVAAFAQSNEGDVSPNVYDKSGLSRGDGRADDEFVSLHTSAQRQFEKARELHEGATEVLTGGVDFIYSHLDYSDTTVTERWTDAGTQRTRRSALGLSKFAGTSDGLGVPFLRQGLTRDKLSWWNKGLLKLWLVVVVQLWSIVSLMLTHNHRRRLALRLRFFTRDDPGQGEKPIALKTGELNGGEDEHHNHVPWTPEVLPLQIVTVGQLALVGVPFECTTVAGRRIRQTLKDALQITGAEHVVLAGLANAYGGYCTTREEYRQQNYEGASTEFGPWQLAATQQKLYDLANLLAKGVTEDPSNIDPRRTTGAEFALQAGVWLDLPWRRFGRVHKQPAAGYARGLTVKVVFWGGHPSNGLQIQSSFLEVQRQDGDGWLTVARDWDPETKFEWQRWMFLTPLSESTVEWTIPQSAHVGTYRIVHRGLAKRLFGGQKPYTGTTHTFEVI